MSFINEVKNPLDNNDFLKSMILLYAKQTTENRKFGRYIYDELIKHPVRENKADKHTYIYSFKKYVEEDIFNLLDENKSENIISIFHEPDLMGFHIYKSKNNKINNNYDIKFYINLGVDTYEFSYIFRKLCEERKLDYAYKVADPTRDEIGRADMMCIYVEYDIAEEYLHILRALKKEHPNFNYMKPSPIMGSIDDWIGVGTDMKYSGIIRSYADSRSLIIENALRSALGNLNEKKIKKILDKSESKLVKKIKCEISKKAAEYSITKHFAFNNIIMKQYKE